MKKYVVSLPEAKLLEPHLPAGFESEFWWYVEHDGSSDVISDLGDVWTNIREHYRAPILEEVLELLPKYIKVDMIDYARVIFPENVGYIDPVTNEVLKLFPYQHADCKDNLATAASMLYRWLEENGHIKETSEKP